LSREKIKKAKIKIISNQTNKYGGFEKASVTVGPTHAIYIPKHIKIIHPNRIFARSSGV
jgi:hypothetical protein